MVSLCDRNELHILHVELCALIYYVNSLCVTGNTPTRVVIQMTGKK